MKQLLVLMMICLLFVWLGFGCEGEDEDESSDSSNNDNEPKTYFNPNLEGFAAGSTAFRYYDGHWSYEEIDQGALPIKALHFYGRDDGYAGGNGSILRFDGQWSSITPGGASGYQFVRCAGSESTVFFLGQDEENTDSVLLSYGRNDGQWQSFNPNSHFGKEDAFIEDIAYTANSGILMLVNWDNESHLLYYNGGLQTETIAAASQNALTVMHSLGAIDNGGGYEVWAGGEHIINYESPEPDKSAILYTRTLGAWQRFQTDERWVYNNVERIVFTAPTRVYMSVRGVHSHSLKFVDGQWVEENLSQFKGERFLLADYSFVDNYLGWAVGYSSHFDEPVMYIHSESGWQAARPPEGYRESGDKLYAVSMYATPQDSQDDDDDDDNDDDDDDTSVD